MSEFVIRKRHQWIDHLASNSSLIAEMDLKSKHGDAVYKSVGEVLARNKDAFNLANNSAHNSFIAATLDRLSQAGIPKDTLGTLVGELIGRNAFGAFSELAVSAFLLDGDLFFELQMPTSMSDVLNPNGSKLDGSFRLFQDIAFDVKSFGFHEHLVSRLVEKLSFDVKPMQVKAEESWDVTIELMEQLLGRPGYNQLLLELLEKNFARRQSMTFRIHPAVPVQVSHRTIDPYRHAEINASYAFRFARQFTHSKPFVLFFVTHPWVGGGLVDQNFQGFADRFTRAFARRTFMQFRHEDKPFHNRTLGEVSRLLSGIIFVDGWQGEEANSLRYRCYFNPFATHPISSGSQHMLAQIYRRSLSVDNFAHDAY
jgi:hypothetical protein